jgi:hypothetical protein
MDLDATTQLSLDVAKAIDDLEGRMIPNPVRALWIAVAILMQPAQRRNTMYDVNLDRVLAQYHTRALLKIDDLLADYRQFDRSIVLKAIIDELLVKTITTHESSATATLEQHQEIYGRALASSSPDN